MHMDSIAISAAILTLLAGIGVFLIACSMMSTNLESIGSSKIKKLFSRVSKSKWLGVGIGAAATAAIQSSGATTVMIIGFVNAGIMSLVQAATMIYGANIGTTITGQIVALGMFGGNSLSTTVFFSAFAGIGAFMILLARHDRLKKIGGILTGFGMLFVGLSMMSSSMESFAQLDGVKLFLANIRHPLLLVLIGTILTAIIQSSSVATSIAITMVVTGLIQLDQGIYLTMGSNIGSCVVAIIAGLTSSTDAKRTALIHLIFNISGVAIFLLIGWLLKYFSGGSISFGVLFERLFPHAPQTQLAMFHTVFNVLTVLFILPLTEMLVKAVMKLIPTRPEQAQTEALHMVYVNDYMLKTPPIAVQQVKNEILRMADLAMKNFETSLNTICSMDFSEVETFRHNEKELNFLNRELVRFIVRLSEVTLDEKDHVYLSTTYHTITDLERVGDYAENIIEYAESLQATNEGFSEQAIAEINHVRALVEQLYRIVMEAYTKANRFLLPKINSIEDRIDDATKDMAKNHVIRLNEGICTPNVGAQYLSLSSNAERVADHFVNIARTLLDYA